jgi:hypothetical protein
MPLAGRVKASVEPQLSDQVAIGALTQTYPPGLVDNVLAQTRRRERRHRLLPARMIVYHLLAMCLFADIVYLEVLRLLVEALRRPSRVVGAPARLPVKSALIQARVRLGPEPLKVLFEQTARAVGDHRPPGGVVSRLAAGGDRRDLPGCGRHARQPGLVRPATQRPWRGRVPQGPGGRAGRVRHPRHHRGDDGALRQGRDHLAAEALGTLDVGMLVLADRQFVGAALWRKAQATGAALLWRVTAGTKTAPALCRLAIAEILTERLPARRLRAFPRAVKRKMSNFAARRAHHRQWPQPTRPDAEAVAILPRAG